MQMFGSRLPGRDSGGQVTVHGDGLASVLDLYKLKVKPSSHKRARIANDEMRIIMELSLGVSQVQSVTHLSSLVVTHTYGLGNAGNAPSMNEQERVRRSVVLWVYVVDRFSHLSVVALVKIAAERIRQLRKEEQALHKGNPSHNAKDGPPSHCYRSPPVSARLVMSSPRTVPMKSKRSLTFTSPTKAQLGTVPSRSVLTSSPPQMVLQKAAPSRNITRSPVKLQVTPFLGRGIAKASWTHLADRPTQSSGGTDGNVFAMVD